MMDFSTIVETLMTLSDSVDRALPKNGVLKSPMKKSRIVFSDALEYADYRDSGSKSTAKVKSICSFGIGTSLTNNSDFFRESPPLNMVIKLHIEGIPVCKIK